MFRKGIEYFSMNTRLPTVFCGLGFLPIAFAVLTSITVITTYVLAVSYSHVYPFFPTISETGEQEPERNLFSLLLCLSSFIGFIVVIVRYKQYNFVSEYNELEQRNLVRVNKIAVVIGVITCAGGAIVATFQADKGTSLRGHLTGATCTFAGGIMYMWLNSYLSMKMISCGINTKSLCALRFIISFLSLATFSVCVTTRYIAIDQWNDGNHRSNDKEHWQPGDSGYKMHLISSITEWVTALLFVVYFLSFYKEFDQIAFELHVKKKTHAALPFEVSSEDRAAPLLA